MVGAKGEMDAGERVAERQFGQHQLPCDRAQQKGDTEGFVNYGLSLDNTVLALIFIENKQEGIIKISLRSKGDFSVNLMAREHFEGGGHTNAAGGKSDRSLEDTVAYFISILPQYKEALNE